MIGGGGFTGLRGISLVVAVVVLCGVAAGIFITDYSKERTDLMAEASYTYSADGYVTGPEGLIMADHAVTGDMTFAVQYRHGGQLAFAGVPRIMIEGPYGGFPYEDYITGSLDAETFAPVGAEHIGSTVLSTDIGSARCEIYVSGYPGVTLTAYVCPTERTVYGFDIDAQAFSQSREGYLVPVDAHTEFRITDRTVTLGRYSGDMLPNTERMTLTGMGAYVQGDIMIEQTYSGLVQVTAVGRAFCLEHGEPGTYYRLEFLAEGEDGHIWEQTERVCVTDSGKVGEGHQYQEGGADTWMINHPTIEVIEGDIYSKPGMMTILTIEKTKIAEVRTSHLAVIVDIVDGEIGEVTYIMLNLSTEEGVILPPGEL
ncbi:MAG: hypothetical protein RBQ77_06035 [Candidatus Methanomethylophilaceae archaeon]|jgi:hypothetical protein|nr:hypothetical protein [Candidatus Methanomethylophilaceae archaeon]